MRPGSFPQRGSLYLLGGALLLGTLWQGAYFPLPATVFALALLAAGGWEAVGTLLTGRTEGLRSPALWLLAAFGAVAALGLFWTISPADSRRGLLLVCGYLAVLFIVRGQAARDAGRTLADASAWLVYVASFVAAWGIGTWIFRQAPYATEVDGLLRAGSTLEYSNALACLMLMTLPVTFALMLGGDSRSRPVFATAAALQAAAVILSLSRSGVVLLAAMTAAALVLSRRRGLLSPVAMASAFALLTAAVALAAAFQDWAVAGAIAVVALLGIGHAAQAYWQRPAAGSIWPAAVLLAAALGTVAVLVLSDAAWQSLAGRFGGEMKFDSLLPHRLDTAAAGIEAFRERPWRGWGLGSFDEAYWQYSDASFTRYAHNLPLQAAVETGIAGALAMTAFLVYVAGLALRRLLGTSPPLARAMGAAALVFIAYNLFDWEWYLPALTGWFMVMVGCMEAGGRRSG